MPIDYWILRYIPRWGQWIGECRCTSLLDSLVEGVGEVRVGVWIGRVHCVAGRNETRNYSILAILEWC